MSLPVPTPPTPPCGCKISPKKLAPTPIEQKEKKLSLQFDSWMEINFGFFLNQHENKRWNIALEPFLSEEVSK